MISSLHGRVGSGKVAFAAASVVVMFAVALPSSAVAGAAVANVSAVGVPGRPVRWLAAGDSYSSGEGLPDVSEPTCQRANRQGGHSSAAWAEVAFEQLSLGADRLAVAADTASRRGFDFEACTGAVSEDLFNNDGGKQEWSLDGNGLFDLVTFSFGGNNVRFADTLYQCLGLSVQGAEAAAAGATVTSLAGGNPISGAVSSWLNHAGCPPEADLRAAIDGLAGPGNDVKGRHLRGYADFLRDAANTVVSPGGNIVVTGYPALIEDPQFWPNLNKAIGTCQGIRERDALLLRRVAGYLNQTIGSAVATVNNEHPNGVSITFVDVNTGQPDHGVAYDDSHLYEPSRGDRHNLCARDPWLNGITGRDRFNGSFHPTQAGHDAMGALIATRIRGLDWTRLRQSLTAQDLLSAPVPEACGHPAGRLSNGELPGIPSNQGSMALSWIGIPSRQATTLVLGDLTGDGQGDAAAVLDCNAGGVAWPELVAFYGPGPVLLGSISLSSVNLAGYSAGENAFVDHLAYDAGKIDVSWSTQQDNDPAAIATLDYSAVFGPADHDTLNVSQLEATTEVPTATKFLAELRAGNVSAAAALAAPGVADQASRLLTSNPDALNATPDCRGIIDLHLPRRVAQYVDAGASTEKGGDRLCLLANNGANGNDYVVLGMAKTGFRAWTIQWVAPA